MKLRPIRHILIIILMIVATHQASAQDSVQIADFINEFNFQKKLRKSFSHGVIVQNGYAILWPPIGEKFYFINIKRIEEAWRLNKHNFKVHAFAFSPDSNLGKLALGCSNGTILVKDFDGEPRSNDLKLAVNMKGHNSNDVTAVAFSPDGQTLASGATDGTIIVWDTTTGNKLLPLFANKSAVNSVVFSPNGEFLISGADDGSVKLWNLHNKSEAQSLINHEMGVQSLAFSPDNNTIASGGKDGKVKLWRVSNKADEIKLSHLMSSEVDHRGGVHTIAFSPDRIHLATGGILGTIFLWNIQDITNIKKIDIKARFKSVYDEIKNIGQSNSNFEDIYKSTHQETLLSIVFSEDGRDLLSISRDQSNEWDLEGIDINPDKLILVEKPEPLIEKLRGQDKTAPIVDNVVYEDEVDSETAETIVSGRVTDLNEIRSFTVNGENVKISENGEFETSVKLKVGENEIPIVAIDRNGNRNDEIKLEIERKRPPDITRPIVKVINKEFNEVNVAYVEYNQDVFEVQVEATDDNSGVKEVRVNGQPANANVNQRFTARVHLQDRKNIVVVAEDNSGNTSDVLTLTVHRKPKPDTELPVITIEGIAVGEQRDVEPSVDTFLVKGKATDDSGINTVKVNNEDVYESKETETEKIVEFNRPVSLQVGNNPITIIAIDNHGNKSEKKLTINRRLSQKPKIDPNVDTTLENTKLDSATTNRSVSSPVTIHITDPDMIEKQVELPRAYPEDEPTCEVSGAVENYKLATSHIDIIIKSKTEGNIKKPFQDSTRLLQLGMFKFKDLPLFIGENEITLRIDLKDGTVPITKRFLIQRISSQSPHRPIQPPGPIDSPTIPPVQNNKPPTLNVSLNPKKRSTKGTLDANSQDEVHVETEIFEPNTNNTNRKKIVVSTEEIVFEGTVEDDYTRSNELKLEIDNTPIGIEQNGGFKHSYPLKYGENQITVTATDKDDEKTTEEYTVYYRPDRDGKDFALFFAMTTYNSDSGWGKLYTPIEDAKIIAEKLEKYYGFKTRVFENPDKNTIEYKLIEYRDKFIDRNDEIFNYSDDSQLLIYFSGHGFSKKTPTLDGEEEKFGFIAPIDSVSPTTNEISAESGSLSFKNLRESIDSILSRRILVLVDTCESGYFDPNFRPDMGDSNSSSNDPMEKIRVNFSKISRRYLTATGKEEALGGTKDKSENSPFAEAFLEALESKGREDNLLEVDEVSEFIKKTKNHPAYKKPGKEVPEPKDGHFESSESGSNFLFFPLPPF